MSSFLNFPNLLEQQRKRKYFNNDPTQDYNYDMTVPNSLPIPNDASPLGSHIPGPNNRLNALAAIVNAISSGIAVGTSNNPSETLSQQLMSQRQEAMQKYQMQQQKEQRQQQQAFEKSQQESAQQQQKELQKSEQVFKSTEGESQFQETLKRDSIKFQNDKSLQQSDQEARMHLLQATQEYEAGEGLKNRQHQLNMEEAKSSNDIKQVMIKSTMGMLLSANKYKQAAPISQVMNIVDKMKNDEALTKEDTAAIDTARRLNALSQDGRGTVTGGKLQQKFDLKDLGSLHQDRTKMITYMLEHSMEPMTNPDGTPKTDVNGRPIPRFTSKDELMQQISDRLNIFDSNAPLDQMQQKQIKQNENPIQQTELNVMNNVNQFLDGGGDPAAIDLSKLPANLRQQVQNRINTKKNKYKPRGF